MKPDKNIKKELQEVAPILAKLDKVNFYQVPESYFNDSQSTIMKSIESPDMQTEQLPLVLTLIKHKELYPAPAASYFESFSESIINKMHAEEVSEELSYTLPILQHIEKKETYKVPATYFSSFPDLMVKLVKKDAIEHTLPVEQWSNRWSELTETIFNFISRPRYAFAMASVVGMIVFIALVVNTQTALSGDEKIFAQMQQLPDSDLHHYIAKHRDEFDERAILHNINNVDFTHYFDKPEQLTPHIESHSKGTTDDETINEDILD